jgi:fermentation-respiration switch protein FrsA (DUF1100 family)
MFDKKSRAKVDCLYTFFSKCNLANLRFLALLSALLFTTLLCSSCTYIFFQPSRDVYPFAEADGLKYSQNWILSLDGKTRLNSWYFSALDNIKVHPERFSQMWFGEKKMASIVKPKGLIVQFHGNAQNMGAHYQFVQWLLYEGYDLLTFDYRGYGASDGGRDLKGANEDVQAVVRYASDLAKRESLPLIFNGESLGGTLLLHALQIEHLDNLKFVWIESSFHSYQEIASEKLALSWITWPFQWLAYLLVSDRYSPAGHMQDIQEVPLVFIYSKEDPIVPVTHGQELYSEAKEVKLLWIHPEPGHVNSMFVARGSYRALLTATIDNVLAGKPINSH